MAEDPWDWSPADVQRFFRNNATDYLHDRPQWNLPASDSFLPVLESECVDGIMLLEHVGTTELKEDLGIRNMRERTAVLHCISKLRRESEGYARSRTQKQTLDDISGMATPVSMHAGKQVNTTLEAQSVALMSRAGENIRPGEQSIQDTKGHKRRRLNPVTLVDAPAPAEVLKQMPADIPHDWFSKSAHPVEELFYGGSGFGQIIGVLQSLHEILPNPIVNVEGKERALDLKNQEDNFQFYNPMTRPGKSHYVYSRIQFFLLHATLDGKSATVLDRHDRNGRDRAAIALLPYGEAFSREPRRSATVIQLDENRKAVAIREDAVLLDSDYTDAGLVEGTGTDNGQWDFLLTKYPKSGSGELPLWGDSGSEDSEGSSFDREMADEGATDITDDDIHLSNTRAAEIIDSIIDEVAHEWLDRKIPAMEKSHAWTVWRRMKGSKSRKQWLIASAQTITAKLDIRLQKLKDEILLDSWRTEAALKEQCKVLEGTVEDREEQKWMISVWQRKKEPFHIIHSKRQEKSQQISTKAATRPYVAFAVQDRLSVSPTAAIYVPALSDQGVEGHGGSPTTSQAGNSIHRDSDEVLLGGQNDDVRSERDDTEPPMSSNTHLAEEEGIDSDIGRHSVSSDDDLPSTEHFVPLKLEPQFAKGEKLHIDLTHTSSDESPQKHRQGRTTGRSDLVSRASVEQRRRPMVFTGDPTDAGCDEVDAWAFAQLERVQDRGRLLIKLLRNLSSDTRSQLHDYCHAKGSTLRPYLRKALSGIHDGSMLAQHKDTAEVLNICARLFLAWHECDHSMMDKDQDEIEWTRILRTADGQLHSFVNMLVAYLGKHKSKLFVSRKRNKSDGPILVVSSDEEENTALITPHKKRKRTVKADASAKTTRQTAQERMVKYQNMVQARSLDPDQSQSMMSTDATQDQIAINPAKDADQDFIHISPRIASKMKGHQVEGVRFMWREITAGDGDNSQGCILAHTMGLGKTMQAIAVLTAVFEAAQSDRKSTTSQLPEHLRRKVERGASQPRALVLCPPSLVQNWRREIDLWAPQHFQVYSIGGGKAQPKRAHMDQFVELQHWHEHGGIMILGYTTFRGMLQRKNGDWSRMSEDEQATVDDILLESTEIVVADEAHTFKNRLTAISQCVMRFSTMSRIALTGTPMSNHVGEVYAMMNWIAPGYLGEVSEFNAFYKEPIEEGQYVDSSTHEIRKSIKKLAVLRHEIGPKVHRADITVLKGFLSKKTEFMITVPLTAAQTESYKRFVGALLGNGSDDDKISQVTMFGWLEALTLLANHPLAFRRKLLETTKPPHKANPVPPLVDIDRPGPAASKVDEQVAEALEDDIMSAADLRVLGLSNAKVEHILEPLADSIDPALSVKTSLFVDILRHTRQAGDKMLVFSMKLRTLEYLSDLLTELKITFGRLEGSTPMNDRITLLEQFHAPNSSLEVLLISTRAGGVGWNITGANRVVIFDFGFNPSDEAQAIGRAYRFGQTKPVYVYRFVGGGTFEMDMHNKQLFKTGLAQRVVDKKNPRRNAMRKTREYLYVPREVVQEELREWLGKDPFVLDKVLAADTVNGRQPRIRAIKTTETLEQDAMDAPLNEEEKKEVDQEIAMGKDRIRKIGKKAVLDIPTFASQPANNMPPFTAPSYRSTTYFHTQNHNAAPQTQPHTPQGNILAPIPKLRPDFSQHSYPHTDELSFGQPNQSQGHVSGRVVPEPDK